MTSCTPSAQVRITIRDFFFFTPFTYAHTLLLGEKLTSGGRIIIRWRINYPGRTQLDQKFEIKISQCRKLSHMAENILFHCGTIPCPLPKTEHHRLYITESIPYLSTLPSYLNTLKNLYPILIHCRIYTLS